MKITKSIICTFALLSAAISANAQVNELRFGRPEHIMDNNARRAPQRIGSQSSASLKAMGQPRIPVVLVQFADTKFTAAGTTKEEVNAYYQQFCNGDAEGHGVGNNHGSIRSYFAAQSDSAFLPQFDILGPVTLSNGVAYYGGNNGSRKDVNFTAFCQESVTLAQNEFEGEWDVFDNNRDGSVDIVFFLFAGLSESNYGGENTIWPKEMTTATTINDIKYACYGCTGELQPTKIDENQNAMETRADGIGVFIHELSHALGLPDFYHTRGGVVSGMDLWSVMDYGEYANNGYRPMNYTAYERDFMGWQSMEELTEPAIVTLLPFAQGGKGYKITNDANPDEYYILENKQPQGWDTSIQKIGHGMLITHVDYNAGAWSSNTVNNNGDHQRMTFIPASNTYDNLIGTCETMSAWAAALAGHLYPGTSLNYNFTDDSAPAGVVYTGGLLGKPIRNITEDENGIITLCFRTNGRLATPELVQYDTPYTWTPIEHATRYLLEIYEGETLLQSIDTTEVMEFGIDMLPQERHLRLRVCAMADSPEDYLSSEWSPWIEIITTNINSIQDQDNLTDVYNLLGHRVARAMSGQLHNLSLPRGIYIIGDKKVIISQ